MRNHRRQKDTPRNASERHGARRNATERDGTPKFGRPSLESAIFWRIRPKFPDIFGAGQPLPQNPNGEDGNAKPPKTKDTPREATERDGTPKFGRPALESGAFRRIPPKFPNIFGAGHPRPQHPIGEGGEYETAEGNRQTAANRGSLRNVTDRRNLATPPWNRANFGGTVPNFLIFLAPETPLSQRPIGEGGGMRNYRRQKDTPRGATERYGA